MTVQGDHEHPFHTDRHHLLAEHLSESNTEEDSLEKMEAGDYTVAPTTPHVRVVGEPYKEPSIQQALFDAPPRRFVIQSVHLRECLAEFIGTFIMIMFGLGVNNQVGLSDDVNGTWLSINICWGIGIMVGVHAAEGVSGAHFNPSVTLANVVYRGMPAWKLPGYVAAQTLACFLGAACIFALNFNRLNVVDPDRTTSRSHYTTFPSDVITNYTAFYSEFLATAMTVMGVFAITDKRNRPAGPYGGPIAFGLLIMAIGMAFGYNTGYALNPARDFGPRLFLSMAGWGSDVFTLRHYYFWIPLVAPLLGGLTGAGMYIVCVQHHHPDLRSPLV